MAVQSHEVRWFFTGTIPHPVLQWINTFGDRSRRREETRTDIYYSLGIADIGLKLRSESRLEIKGCVNSLPSTNLSAESASQIIGNVEDWIKWQIPVSRLTRRLFRNRSAIRIFKERTIYHFTSRGPQTKQILPHRGSLLRINGGLQLELTGLTMRSATYWSFGLEAFPWQGGALQLIRSFAQSHLKRWPVDLLEQNSMSYPQWLCIHTSGK